MPLENPGSPSAVGKGCTCPIQENKHGFGIDMGDGPVFWTAPSCPLHNDPETMSTVGEYE